MPQERQNGAVVPVPSDEYNLTADLVTLADSLNIPVPVSSVTQRNELAPYEGLTVMRLDLAGVNQVYVNGAWRTNYVAPYRQWFAISERVVDNEGMSWSITLPSGLFTRPPLIFLTKQTGGGAGYIPYHKEDDTTTTQAQIGVYWKGNTDPYTVRVGIHAVQASPSNSVGLIAP